MVFSVREGVLLLMVVLADCDGPTPPPEAVAMFVMEFAAMSVWVMVYVAAQVTVACGARVVSGKPQLIGVVLM